MGPDGKIFGSRSGRTDRAKRGLYFLTESQIFSCPARPYSVNKHFIIWPLTVENFENSVWTHRLRRQRAQSNYIKVSATKICHLFFFFEQGTFNWSKKWLIYRKPTESWHKPVKNRSKPLKNLTSDKRSLHASMKLFTNLLHLKTHENVGVVSSYLSTSYILLSKGQPATEY